MSHTDTARELLNAAYYSLDTTTEQLLNELTTTADHAQLCEVVAVWIGTTHQAAHAAGRACPSIVGCGSTRPSTATSSALNMLNAGLRGDWQAAGEAMGAAIAADAAASAAAEVLGLCVHIMRRLDEGHESP